MAYVDYKQAFLSVPHSYLIDILKTYKICPRMIYFLRYAMYFWGTRIKYFDREKPRVTRFLRITNSIFQGDLFSAMWLCLTLNPLSMEFGLKSVDKYTW